jgi:DNA ligase 1
VLLAELVATSEEVSATRSRRAKTSLLAELLRGASADEAALAVGMLVGALRQGRVGIGWGTVGGLDVPPARGPSLTIVDVDVAVDAVRVEMGPGSQARRAAVLGALWSRATAAEQGFLARLFVGELRQGALEGVMVDAVALAAGVDEALVRRAAMVSGDLRLVAATAMGGGSPALQALGLEVGRGVLPMLASTAADIDEALARTGRASVEWKLDGVRVQVHKQGDQVTVLTRNLNDVTARSATVVELVRGIDAELAVLDGEALLVDGRGRPEPFQDSMSRFGTSDAGAVVSRLTPFFFDLLHHDGTDLLDLPLSERQHRLDELVPERARVPRVVTGDPEVARDFLDRTVAAGHEGVVVKAVSSPYEAGRRGALWQKVKPVHTLDLVVLAAEWGHGRRRGWLSNLHLGARDPLTGSFTMLGKTFKGLTDELLEWQTGRLLELVDRHEGGTVHVRPELVVEVAADGVQRSTRYPAGVALRFARVRRYRPDKRPDEADTVSQVRALGPDVGPT